MKNKNYPIKSTISFSGLFLLLFLSIAHAQGNRGGNAQRPLPVVVAPAILQQDFGDTLEALGTTRANESVSITANVTEFVRELLFDDGDTVKRGDILVVFEKEEEEASLKSARAQYDERLASFNRAKELVQQQALSTATLEEREALLRQIQGTIEGVEAQLNDRVVRAPFDGVLGLRQISPGALVRPGDPISTLDDISRIKVDFSAPSIFLSALRPGLAIEGTVDAYGNEVFTGSVSSVDTRIDPVTRTIGVRAILPNEDGRLLPGLLMSIRLQKNPRSGLIIPESAIVQRGPNSFVFVIQDRDNQKIAVETQVQTGARIPGKVEIVSGLKEGDHVIVHGLMQVQSGRVVEIRGVQTGNEPLTSFTGDNLKERGSAAP